MLKRYVYMSPTGPNKYLRGFTTTKTDQLEVDLFKVEISKDCKEKYGKLNTPWYFLDFAF